MLSTWIARTYTEGGSRLPAATSRDGKGMVSPEERLGDVGLLAIVAAEIGGPLLKCADAMVQRAEALARPGVLPPAIWEADGQPSSAGGVYEAFEVGLWALGATRVGASPASMLEAVNWLDSIGWSEVASSEGDILVAERRLGTAALGVLLEAELALKRDDGINHPKPDGLSRAAERLSTFWREGRFWDRLDAAGEPIRSVGTTSHDLAWAIISARSLATSPDWTNRINRSIDLLTCAILPNAWQEGIWSQIDAKREVSTSSNAALGRRDRSPFPAVLAADQALILRAIHNLNSPEVLKIRAVAFRSLQDLIDPAGGVNIGQGSWFSTPNDPTVPLARLVSAVPRSPGAFAVGNSDYIPITIKIARTQVLAVWTPAEYIPAVTPNNVQGAANFTFRAVEFDPLARPVSSRVAAQSAFDRQAYINWVHRTKQSSGFGLTPYAAPLSLRADSASQVFSMVHVLADLAVLDEPLPEPIWVTQSLVASRNIDGGFGERAGLPSEVFTTYCAVLSGLIAGAEFGDVAETANFVQSAQRADGGFGNAPGAPSDVWHSHLAALTLAALKQAPIGLEALHSFVRSARNEDGGYGERPGRPSDVFATFRAIGTLLALNMPIDRPDQTIAYLSSLQTPGGGFRYKAGAAVSFVGSYHAIAGLYVLGVVVPNPESARQYIVERQASDGGFGRAIGRGSETTDEGFVAVQALHILDGSLDATWALMLT